MRWRWWIPAGVGTLAGALALLSNPQSHLTAPEPLTRRFEVARLRAHFDSVDVELRGPHELQLTPGQSTTRATLIGWLREYRNAERFPQNDRFPGRAVPFFRDSRGVLCAMAYLIDRSGRQLRAWLDSVHLSVAEAARIQPSYNGDEDQVSADYAVTSILVSGASLTTVGLNLLNPSKSTGWAGLVAGSVGVLAGAVKLGEGGGTVKVATANLIIGGGAVATGLYRLLSPGNARPATGPAPESAASQARLALSPLVIPTPDGPRFGLTMHSSF